MDAIDLIEIHQLLGRYGHAIDERDWVAFAGLFLPDAVLDYTAVRAPQVCNGIAEILEYFHEANHPSAHHVTNIVVDPVAGTDDEATVHSKWFVPFTRAEHRPVRWAGGDYHDIVVRTGEGWRFRRKECTQRWQYTQMGQEPLADHRRTF